MQAALSTAMHVMSLMLQTFGWSLALLVPPHSGLGLPRIWRIINVNPIFQVVL